MIVGLTGGIGSGKTTVLNMFRELEVPTYIADKESKRLMKTEPIRNQIINLLGSESYIGTEINAPFISKKVFNDKQKLEKLNQIIRRRRRCRVTIII